MENSEIRLPYSVKVFDSWLYYFAVVFLIVWILIWLGLGIRVSINSSDLSEWIYTFLGLFVAIYYLIIVLTANVIFDEQKIIYKSFFKNVSIDWNEVETFGGFYESRQFIEMIPTPEIRNKSIFDGNKNLFVSTIPNFRPRKWNFISNHFISFPYRPEIYDFVVEKVKV